MTLINENKSIATEFNQCLKRHKLTYAPTFDLNDFSTTVNIITNYLATSKLSDLIFINYFPQNPISEYHHFTDPVSFENILATKKLYLFSVEKRFSEKEFKPFYTAHKMDGYELQKNNHGVPLERELVKNAFYTSFTNDKLTKAAEEHMWKCFAKNTGVRMVFEVKNVNTDLRQVFYPPSSTKSDLPLLTDLISIASKRQKYLILDRLATIGFFYLPHYFNIEQEYRLLVKRTKGRQFDFKFCNKDNFEYMEFPFNDTNPIAELKLNKIIFETNTDKAKAEEIIKSNAEFANIPIEKRNNILKL